MRPPPAWPSEHAGDDAPSPAVDVLGVGFPCADATIETVAAGPYSVKGGFQIDGSIVKFWGRKPHAVAGARAIGWPVGSVELVHTRFQIGYALRQAHGGFLTKTGYDALLAR